MRTRRVKRTNLTTPDLVILSLLDERPRHGYDVNAELERRQVRDWAALSRPQIYYSLDKLARLRLVRALGSPRPPRRPPPPPVAPPARGRAPPGPAPRRPAPPTPRRPPPLP